jgi:hypothetical protein
MGVQSSRDGEKCLRRNFLNIQGEIRNTGKVLREKFLFSDERREIFSTIKRKELFGNTLQSA